MPFNPKSSGTEDELVPTQSKENLSVAKLIQPIDFANLPATLVPKQGIVAAISVSPSTLKHYRKHFWIEGIHFFT